MQDFIIYNPLKGLKLTPFIGDGNYISALQEDLVVQMFKTNPVYRGRKLEKVQRLTVDIAEFKTNPVYRGRKLDYRPCSRILTINPSLKLTPFIGDGNILVSHSFASYYSSV